MIECITQVHEYWSNHYTRSYIERAGQHLFQKCRKAHINVQVNQSDKGCFNVSYEVEAPHGEVVALNRRYCVHFESEYTALINTIERAKTKALMLGAECVEISKPNGIVVQIDEFLTILKAKETKRLEELASSEKE